jgi:hypothetical protein
VKRATKWADEFFDFTYIDINLCKNSLQDRSCHLPYENVVASERASIVKDVLATLTPAEQAVLVMRFGLDGNESMTVQMNLSKSTLRCYRL